MHPSAARPAITRGRKAVNQQYDRYGPRILTENAFILGRRLEVLVDRLSFSFFYTIMSCSTSRPAPAPGGAEVLLACVPLAVFWCPSRTEMCTARCLLVPVEDGDVSKAE